MNLFLPKKRFGQNFLIDKNVLARIGESCSLEKEESVLEIGPGQGALTRVILPRVKRVIAIEADIRLEENLRREFSSGSFVLHHADILKFDLSSLSEYLPVKVLGNIPYNISTPIIEKFIAARAAVKSLFLTVQYEFGARLIAGAGTKDYSALTCLINTFAIPKILFRISNKAFRPMPKVESCFMRIDFRPVPIIALTNEAFFIKLVHQVFLHRRKTIVNALMPLTSKEKACFILGQAEIPENDRPGNISFEKYAKIANLFCKES